ncbi:TonB-dependent receptor [Colwellia sp. 75C3]|uniref:TonB-dependent receptor n=1 Tax=Colwellia sp. 75C3 TaxID=888425 RepID=UPI000C31D3C3|nr:TonB-dependent receptor [Colwellia sp. 75C3]PKG81512.1 TonB-dependent receptor [Colwellia sp. 75C3]
MIKSNFKARRSLAAIAVGTALMLSAPSVMAADAFNGSVKGVVTNTDNQVTQGAVITLVHKGKGITRTIKTNEKGEYSLRKLPIGEYEMTIVKDGYNTIEKHDLTVTVGGAITFNGMMLSSSNTDADVERISVVGSRISRVNLESSTGGLIITAGELDKMPVESGFEAMALLAPGTTSNSEFGGASIGGSSSAENGYYLNGINITSIKTGIGSISMPWEAIAQTEIKTGGIDPEFGGALGGIVNAISKSGSNEFEFGGYARVDPEATRSHHNNLYKNDGSMDVNTAQDESTFTRFNIWASGALIEDSLFFYALYEPQKKDYKAAKTTTLDNGETTSDRYFGKLDWYINDNHSVEFTAIGFDEKGSGESFENDPMTQTVGKSKGAYASSTGGDVYGLKYTGLLNDDMSIELVAGRTTDETNNVVVNTDPLVWSKLTDTWHKLSSETANNVTESEFVRDQVRLDFNWTLEDHDIKMGVDYTNIDVDFTEWPNGVPGREGWWEARKATGAGHDGLPEGTPYVDQRIRTDYTDSDVTSTAFYIQDVWTVTDQLVLNVGVRYSNVSNTISDGRKYVDVKGQIAPRAQVNYDLFGDGGTKLFATYGRYFQPVSANMNITQGGSRNDHHEYYNVGQVDANGEVVLLADGSPSTGDNIGSYTVPAYQEPDLIVASNLESMYTDEITFGFEQELMDGDMVLGMRAIYRDLGRSIEDTDYGQPIAAYFEKNGIVSDVTPGYVLANPGQDFEMQFDMDGDGVKETLSIPKSELQLPEAERQYGALETTLGGIAGDSFHYNASYTWSHGWGNTEGLVRTDNGQADPGWTTSYDYADLMDHSNGNLPNDRRHAFKFNGYYEITEALTLGFNARIVSGAPMSKFSMHPDGVDSCAAGNVWASWCGSQWYGDASFYDEDGTPVPRGTAGTTDWTKELDLSLSYNVEVGGGDLLLKATAYNVLNSDDQLSVEEVAGADWGNTTGRVGARYMSFEASYRF